MKVAIVYEDDWLLVVNKPSGILTIPAPNKKGRTLLQILNEEYKQKNADYNLYLCHRLDKDTSGLIISAKGKSIQQKMMQEFKEKRVKKVYIALVDGRLTKAKGTIKNVVDGKRASTDYQALKRLNNFSLVRISPLTGRKNQIRIHFKQIGHPILGENRFAFRKDFKVLAKKLCLHAKALDFRHPITTKPIHLEAELPDHFRDFL